MNSFTNRKVVRAKRAREITGLGKSEIYRKSGDPEDLFPAAIKIGDHSLAWYEDELIKWQESRPRAIEKLQSLPDYEPARVVA